uniref:Uncharacterized protein n=1 Tax=Parascaris equorum TaxID=6256 RepID=A0A914RAD5_PAREQ
MQKAIIIGDLNRHEIAVVLIHWNDACFGVHWLSAR